MRPGPPGGLAPGPRAGGLAGGGAAGAGRSPPPGERAWGARQSPPPGGPASAERRAPSLASRPGALAALAALALAAALAAPGCASGRSAEPRPTASLAESGTAAQSFAWLRRRWATASHDERLALESYIRSLRALYGHEPVAAVAELYLAWLALEKGDPARALSIAAALERAGPGATLDLARTVRGAALVHAGRPAEGLAWLSPLRGKLLDLDARELYYEASGRALVETRGWGQAIDLFDAWLRDGSDETRPELAARVETALAAVPAPELERALAEMRQSAAQGVPRHAELTRRLVAKRLATLAVERRDVALARRLLAQRDGFGELGDASAGVAELAGYDAPAPRVAGRALGLLMPRAREAPGQRALAFSQGLFGALRSAPGEAPRVATRSLDEPGAEPRAALHALLTEGAAVLVGGFDPQGASELAEFAEREGVVAFLAVPPASWPPSPRWSFALGVDEAAATGLVARALAERAEAPVLALGPAGAAEAAPGARPLAGPGCPEDAPSRHTFGERLLEGARPGGAARAMLLAGDERCARLALGPLARAGRKVPLGLGLEASALLASARDGEAVRRLAPPASLAFVRAGCYPADEQGRPSPPLLALAARTGRPPSWWALLGHEAAWLAAQALAPLPPDATGDAAGLRFRRALALSGARSAAPLPCLGPPPSPGPGGATLEPRVSFVGRADAASPNVSAPR
ncbi:MAG TPA: hypothetical protein VFS43_43975 [Polyangiaceae bacterium]|nr:hypothetical protein [Polyangiaceae bacterium]